MIFPINTQSSNFLCYDEKAFKTSRWTFWAFFRKKIQAFLSNFLLKFVLHTIIFMIFHGMYESAFFKPTKCLVSLFTVENYLSGFWNGFTNNLFQNYSVYQSKSRQRKMNKSENE